MSDNIQTNITGRLTPCLQQKIDKTRYLVEVHFSATSIALQIILLIKIFQFFTKLGTFDVDDIILNMIGIVCGYLMFLVIKRIFVRDEGL